MDQSISINGNTIFLRDFSLSDLEAFENWQRPGHLWQTMDGPYYKTGVDDSKDKAQRLRAKIESNDFPSLRAVLAIADRRTNQLLGIVTSYWESKETNWLCIGIIVYDPSFWGKGIGFEAVSLWMQYLFNAHKEIVRLDMRTWSGNKGLMSLAKKLGFMQEACFRKARIVNGEYFDGLGYGILRSEWEAQHLENKRV